MFMNLDCGGKRYKTLKFKFCLCCDWAISSMLDVSNTDDTLINLKKNTYFCMTSLIKQIALRRTFDT